MKFPRMTRRATGALAVALVIAVCGACSSSGSSSTGTGSGNSSAKTASAAPLKVAVLTISSDVPIWMAQQEGLFAKHGLNVTLVPVVQSTLAVPDLEHGEVQIVAGANYVSFFRAQESGAVNVKILNDSQGCVPNSHEILVSKGSAIHSPQELAGKTIAVNILNDIQTLTINEVLAADGVNTNSLHYIAVPFPDMGAALTAGRVQAIFEVEPYLSEIKATAGAREVLDDCQGPTANLPLAGDVATSAWVAAHPVQVAEFKAAVNQAQSQADTDQSLVRKVAEKELHVNPTIGAIMNTGTWPIGANATQIQRTADQMLAAGMLKKPLKVGPLIAS